jgi:hypothetical protein
MAAAWAAWTTKPFILAREIWGIERGWPLASLAFFNVRLNARGFFHSLVPGNLLFYGEMSVQEIKNGIVQLTPEERFDLAVFLQHLTQKDDPDHQRELDEANDRITSGHGISLEELRKMAALVDHRS